MSTTPHAATKGLQDVIAGESKICFIDGDRGILAYRGIDIHDLADHSTFEETCYLLWFGKLPTRAELTAFSKQLADARVLDKAVVELMKSFPKSAAPMEVLRTATSALSFYDPDASK